MFGESFLQGFDALAWEFDLDKDRAVSVNDKEISYIKNLAKTYNISISFVFLKTAAEVCSLPIWLLVRLERL